MKMLIVDDDKPKLEEIKNFVRKYYSFAEVSEKISYQSGLKEIMTNTPNLILLDMNMRTYDPSAVDPTGGKPRHLAGLDILHQIKRKNLSVKVIVITQFPIFGGGKDEKTLEEITRTLKTDFSEYFLGTVFYIYSEDSWMQTLKQYIDKFIEEGK